MWKKQEELEFGEVEYEEINLGVDLKWKKDLEEEREEVHKTNEEKLKVVSLEGEISENKEEVKLGIKIEDWSKEEEQENRRIGDSCRQQAVHDLIESAEDLIDSRCKKDRRKADSIRIEPEVTDSESEEEKEVGIMSEFRKAKRIQLREGQKIRTKRLTEEEVRIEKVQIKCPVPGINFKTEYLGTLLAKEKNDVHWRAQYEAKFEQEELDRKSELEEQEKRASEQKEKAEERKKSETIMQELRDQELIRKDKEGLGRLIDNQDGKLDIVLFDTDERKECEDLKEEDSGVESI